MKPLCNRAMNGSTPYFNLLAKFRQQIHSFIIPIQCLHLRYSQNLCHLRAAEIQNNVNIWIPASAGMTQTETVAPLPAHC